VKKNKKGGSKRKGRRLKKDYTQLSTAVSPFSLVFPLKGLRKGKIKEEEKEFVRARC
jgi:hypothetical protein